MRIVDVREQPIRISRYLDPHVPSGGLTTSLVAVVTDVARAGQPVAGYGFASVGRYAQSGLIRERFAPRLLRAAAEDITTGDGANLDPFRAWAVMMAGEKPGGHGERCVAVGALDMALWDAAAKIAGMPLHAFLAGRLGRTVTASQVPVYASGGYPYPEGDITALPEEIRHFTGLGFTHVKIKIGSAPLDEDLRRIEAAAACLDGSDHLAVDAMNAYDPGMALTAATALARFGLWWFEDICDPLDFATHARVAACYDPPIAAGEALFSAAEAALLDRYAGLRRGRDVLLFDPVHCYGLPGYLQIIDTLTAAGWPRHAFRPHGGHLFSLHLAAALGLGGAEINPLAFHPFHGPPPALPVSAGRIGLPDVPGIGFELHDDAWRAFRELITPPGRPLPAGAPASARGARQGRGTARAIGPPGFTLAAAGLALAERSAREDRDGPATPRRPGDRRGRGTAGHGCVRDDPGEQAARRGGRGAYLSRPPGLPPFRWPWPG